MRPGQIGAPWPKALTGTQEEHACAPWSFATPPASIVSKRSSARSPLSLERARSSSGSARTRSTSTTILVATGGLQVEDGRVPLSDGAGEVVAVGTGVFEFAVGDAVVSTFFPGWTDGLPGRGGSGPIPGDNVDGYACELATAPVAAFTRAPAGYGHAEAATLPCAPARQCWCRARAAC